MTDPQIAWTTTGEGAPAHRLRDLLNLIRAEGAILHEKHGQVYIQLRSGQCITVTDRQAYLLMQQAQGKLAVAPAIPATRQPAQVSITGPAGYLTMTHEQAAELRSKFMGTSTTATRNNIVVDPPAVQIMHPVSPLHEQGHQPGLLNTPHEILAAFVSIGGKLAVDEHDVHQVNRIFLAARAWLDANPVVREAKPEDLSAIQAGLAKQLGASPLADAAKKLKRCPATFTQYPSNQVHTCGRTEHPVEQSANRSETWHKCDCCPDDNAHYWSDWAEGASPEPTTDWAERDGQIRLVQIEDELHVAGDAMEDQGRSEIAGMLQAAEIVVKEAAALLDGRLKSIGK